MDSGFHMFKVIDAKFYLRAFISVKLKIISLPIAIGRIPLLIISLNENKFSFGFQLVFVVFVDYQFFSKLVVTHLDFYEEYSFGSLA